MTRRLQRLEGVDAVSMNFDTKIWTVTLKKDVAVQPAAVREACDIGSVLAGRIELTAAGTATLEKDRLSFRARDSKLGFSVAVKKIKDSTKQKELQKTHDDLIRAVKDGHTLFTLTGDFADVKNPPLSLTAFKRIKKEGR